MTTSEGQAVTWPAETRLPRYYSAIQLMAISLGYATILMVVFFQGAVGPLSGLGLFLALNVTLGIAAGATSPSMGRGILVALASVALGMSLTFLLLNLPVTFNVIDSSLTDLIISRMTLQVVFSFLTLPFSLVTVILGSAIYEHFGLPGD